MNRNEVRYTIDVIERETNASRSLYHYDNLAKAQESYIAFSNDLALTEFDFHLYVTTRIA